MSLGCASKRLVSVDPKEYDLNSPKEKTYEVMRFIPEYGEESEGNLNKAAKICAGVWEIDLPKSYNLNRGHGKVNFFANLDSVGTFFWILFLPIAMITFDFEYMLDPPSGSGDSNEKKEKIYEENVQPLMDFQSCVEGYGYECQGFCPATSNSELQVNQSE